MGPKAVSSIKEVLFGLGLFFLRGALVIYFMWLKM